MANEYDPKVSIAPVEGTVACPGCGVYAYSYDRGRGANVCHGPCGREDRITPDHIPRLWTEAELRALFQE